jgi:hypothetical protein
MDAPQQSAGAGDHCIQLHVGNMDGRPPQRSPA